MSVNRFSLMLCVAAVVVAGGLSVPGGVQASAGGRGLVNKAGGGAPELPVAWNEGNGLLGVVSATSVGYLPGSGEVLPGMGSYTYTLPLEVPAGVGVAPSLALQYSSANTGNGLVGVGWQVSGFSALTRCGAQWFGDGYVDAVEFGSLTDAAADQFCLDGQRLVRISGTHGQAGAVYHTLAESYAEIRLMAADGVGPTAWEVRLKDGRIRRYDVLEGNRFRGVTTNDGTYETLGAARAVWALREERDRAGNMLEVEYAPSSGLMPGHLALPGQPLWKEWVPKEIRYSAHKASGLLALRKVTFEYETFAYGTTLRPDAEYGFQATLPNALLTRLASITMHAPNPEQTMPVWQYRFSYESNTGTAGVSTSSGRSLLASVERCGRMNGQLAGCEWKKRFAWSQAAKVPSFTVQNLGTYPLNYGVGTSATGQGVVLKTLDANGDGKADVMMERRDWLQAVLGDEDGVVLDATLRLGQAGTGALSAPINVKGVGAYSSETRLGQSHGIDVNSDGKTELMAKVVTAGQSTVIADRCVQRLMRWEGSSDPATPGQFVNTSWASAEEACFGWPTHQQLWLDWDGDGRPDVLEAQDTIQYVPNGTPDPSEVVVPGTWKLRRNQGGVLGAQEDTTVKATCRGQVADLDGDERNELLTATEQNGDKCGKKVVIRGADKSNALTRTTYASVGLANEFAEMADPGTLEGDFNGDGLSDLLVLHPFVGANPANPGIRWNTGQGFGAEKSTTVINPGWSSFSRLVDHTPALRFPNDVIDSIAVCGCAT